MLSLQLDMKMMRIVIASILSVLAMGTSAQTVISEGKTLREDSVRQDADLLPTDSLLQQYDSTLWKKRFQPMTTPNAGSKLDINPSLYDSRRGSWEVNTMHGGKLFSP